MNKLLIAAVLIVLAGAVAWMVTNRPTNDDDAQALCEAAESSWSVRKQTCSPCLDR